MHAPSTTSDPTACSHPYAGARSSTHSDRIAPEHNRCPCPPLPRRTHTWKFYELQLDQQHHDGERRLRQRRHDLRLAVGSGCAWMNARAGGCAGRWLGAGGRGGEGAAGERGGRQSRAAATATPRTEKMRKNVSAAPPLSHAEDAGAGSSSANARTPRAPEPRRAGTTRLSVAGVCTREPA
eukprot:COSAG06_NODE_6694_length_2821_cov_26.501470_3_plen_181_part_00